MTMRVWGWGGLLGALALTACGVEPEAEVWQETPPVQEEPLSSLHGQHKPDVLPTWDQPTGADDVKLATDGKQFLVVWRDFGRPGELYAARVSRIHKLLDAESIPLNPGGVEAGDPAVAYNGRDFIVVWKGQFELFMARVTRDGELADPPRAIASIRGSPAPEPAIDCGWQKCLVAWKDSGDSSIRAAALRFKGHDVDITESYVSAAPAISSFGVSVAWSPRHHHYLVAWSDARSGTLDIHGSRVKSDGTVVNPGGFPISTAPDDQTRPDVIGTDQGFFVAWSDERSGNPDLYGSRVGPRGEVLDPLGIPISTTEDREILPALAYDDRRVLVTWTSLGTDSARTFGNLVAPDGRLAMPGGVLLSSAQFPREAGADVVYSRGLYFLAYSAGPTVDEPAYRVVLGTRLSRSLRRIDWPAIRISHSPAVETP